MSQHRHAIENLLHRYAAYIDAGNFTALAQLFENAVICDSENQELARGSEAVLALYRSTTRLYECGTPKTRHVTTNLILELAKDEQTAIANSYFTVLQQLEDFPLQTIIAGRYCDHFSQRDGQWAFSRRQMMPEQIGDLSRHLLIALP